MINPHCRTTVQILVSVAWDIISLHLKYDTDSQCSGGGGGGGERLFPPLGDSCKTNWLQKLIKQHLRYKISRKWFLPSHFASNYFHRLLVLKWQQQKNSKNQTRIKNRYGSNLPCCCSVVQRSQYCTLLVFQTDLLVETTV